MKSLHLWEDVPPPEEGPPVPPSCPDGWGSHVWQLGIECGSMTLQSDCTICNRGLWADEWAFEYGPVPVNLTVVVDFHGDADYSYIQLNPQETS